MVTIPSSLSRKYGIEEGDKVQFVEDELAYYSQNLITSCQDSDLAPLTDDWTKKIDAPPGRYFLGVDLGKKISSPLLQLSGGIRRSNTRN